MPSPGRGARASAWWCASIRDRTPPTRCPRPSARPMGPYSGGVLTTAGATAAGVLINDYVGLPNLSLIFVVPVMVAAARHGLVPSLWVSALSVLCFNFFFLPPLYQFTIADPANLLAL